jgi:hypothetical protein
VAPIETPQRAAMRRAHAKLGPGKWEVANEHDLTNHPLLREIIEATGIYEGDYAGARVRLQLLLGLGALRVAHNDDGSLTYTKCPFPDEPEDSLGWVERENARLAKAHADNLAWQEREYQLARQAQETIDAPIRAAEAAAFVRAWRQNQDAIRAMVKEVVTEVLAELHQEPASV